MQNAPTIAGQPPAIPYTGTEARDAPRPWLQDLWLWILLVGPLAAPLFRWTGIAVLQPFADGIYFLGQMVCPKVEVRLMLLGYPLSVCSSCWFSVFGLWTVRLLYGRAGEGMGAFSRLGMAPAWARWTAAPSYVKLSALVALFMPWAFDVTAWDIGLWASPHPFMMLVGYLGGVGAGLLLLPASSEMRARTARQSSA